MGNQEKLWFSLVFFLLTVSAIEAQARLGGQGGGMQDQGMGMHQGSGNMEMDRMREPKHQSMPNQNQEIMQQQRREMMQEQNRIQQTAPAGDIESGR